MSSLILLNRFVDCFNKHFNVVIDKNFEFKKIYNKHESTFYITYTLHREFNPDAFKKVMDYESYIDKYLIDFSILDSEEQPHQKEIDDTNEKIHKILKETGYLSFQKVPDTYQLIRRNWFRLLREYDSYGSSLLHDVKSKTIFSLFNNYYDIGFIRDELTLYTPFIIRGDWVCEVGDICFNIDTKKFYLNNYNIFQFPDALRKIPLDAFSGMAAFYYQPDINTVLLKCDDFTVTKIPASIIRSNGYINLVYDKSLLRKIKLEKINI